MKMKLLFSVAFLSFFGNVFCQEYHPFLNNSSWILYDTHCCIQTYIRPINEGTDVAIGDYTYKKFKDPYPQRNAMLGISGDFTLIDTVYVREDVAAKKVYHIVNGADELLYDFSKETGDTFSQYGYNWEVILVDDIEVDGGTRKRITLRTTEYHYGFRYVQRWIEGVGSNAHPFYPQSNMSNIASGSGGHNIFTKCSFQDGVHLYGDITYCSAALGTQEIVQNDAAIAFSPNPFATQLTISSALPLQKATLKLYNIQGQLVREIRNLHGVNSIVNRENLNRGLYLAKLIEEGKLVKTAKIIVD